MSERPTLLVIAGPNGSGKTTLTNRLRGLNFDFGIYVNADEIAARLQTDNNAAAPEASIFAQREADRLRRTMLDEGTSFSFETVMSHPSKVEEMEEARALGFHVTLFFVAVDNPEINVGRVAQRVARGGHDVPTDKIVARYERTMRLLPRAIRAAHRSVIFDNSDLVRDVQQLAGARSTRKRVELRVNDFRPWFQHYCIDGLAKEFGGPPKSHRALNAVKLVFLAKLG
jgi:predicted ABC-type ATPase